MSQAQSFFKPLVSNTSTVAEALTDVAAIAEAIPYLEGIAGVVHTMLRMKQVSSKYYSSEKLVMNAPIRSTMSVKKSGKTHGMLSKA
jgi:hypothetical protein